MEKKISNMREDYKKGFLLEGNVLEDPYDQFNQWLQQAISADIPEANAMNLATVDESGRPSSRIVLLKDVDQNGFIFYTNYESRKGVELNSNPFAALNFLWKELERQVRIEGKVERVSRARSKSYFHTRPYGSQIGALSSSQSKVVEDRKSIETRYEQNFENYRKEGKAPLPENWGGYKLVADYFEFWQGRESRLHDRITYRLEEDRWVISRLEP